jgi:hypothetical protein
VIPETESQDILYIEILTSTDVLDTGGTGKFLEKSTGISEGLSRMIIPTFGNDRNRPKDPGINPATSDRFPLERPGVWPEDSGRI